MKTETMTPSERGGTLPPLIVRLAGLWILAGALFKLLQGTPNDLPQIVRDFPLELGLTYKLAITLELCVAFVALLRPRWAWLLLCLVFLLFDAVLMTQIVGGAASCGCFGSQISIAPGTMLAIDTALLIGLVVTKPWSSLRTGGPNPLVITTALALGVALPWLLEPLSSYVQSKVLYPSRSPAHFLPHVRNPPVVAQHKTHYLAGSHSDLGNVIRFRMFLFVVFQEALSDHLNLILRHPSHYAVSRINGHRLGRNTLHRLSNRYAVGFRDKVG